MNAVRSSAVFFAGVIATTTLGADDIFDRVADALTFTNRDASVRAHVSGLLDLEGYHASAIRSDLRFDDENTLFNPRLALFLDAQAGTRAYLFAQTRVDRGLDPSDAALRIRLDELAVRLTLAPRGALTVQAGKFATVFGAWSPRHHSWENPLVSAPLIFENLTGMWDGSATTSTAQLLRRAHVEPLSDGPGVASDKNKRLPMVWGPAYGTGIAMAGKSGGWEYAAELKNAALSSRPSSWNFDDRPWGAPTASARVAYRPNEMWTMGISGSRGTYLRRSATPTTAPGSGASDHRQEILGGDVAYAHRHLQCWAEAYTSRFAIPGIGAVRTFGYYVEARYKFRPQWSGAVRWNQQTFSTVVTDDNRRVRWGRDIWRVDLALIHRLSAHAQLKLQYSPQGEQPAPQQISHAFFGQFTTRF